MSLKCLLFLILFPTSGINLLFHRLKFPFLGVLITINTTDIQSPKSIIRNPKLSSLSALSDPLFNSSRSLVEASHLEVETTGPSRRWSPSLSPPQFGGAVKEPLLCSSCLVFFTAAKDVPTGSLNNPFTVVAVTGGRRWTEVKLDL